MPGPSVPVPVKKGQGEAVGRAVAFTPYFSGGGNARCLILKKGPPQSVRQSGLSPDSSPVPVYLPPIPPLSFILLQRWADRVNTVPISSLVVGPPLSRAIKDDGQKIPFPRGQIARFQDHYSGRAEERSTGEGDKQCEICP